jgi:hypothetical protein
MKNITIIAIVTIINITIFLILANKEREHKCHWITCPVNSHYSEFSNDWFIQKMHLQNPEKKYQECQYILFVNSEDTTIN